jgi:NADPH-dependent ferric siderophore reductase
MNDTSNVQAAPAARKARPLIRLEVLRREQLSGHMVRIIAGGEGFKDFVTNDFTDKYVKILFLQPGTSAADAPDMAALREALPREQWPVTRTYTVRWVDPAARQLAIDFVVHGDEGLAGPWAAAAQPGDELLFASPGGAYAPNPAADWHLFAGDEAALPAIAAGIEALPADAVGTAFVEVGTAGDMQAIAAPDGVEVTWLLRAGDGGTDPGAGTTDLLVRAIAEMDWREGDVHAFVHGERGYMKALRDILFKQRGLQRSQVSLSGYWALGRAEDQFQAEKKTAIGKIL